MASNTPVLRLADSKQDNIEPNQYLRKKPIAILVNDSTNPFYVQSGVVQANSACQLKPQWEGGKEKIKIDFSTEKFEVVIDWIYTKKKLSDKLRNRLTNHRSSTLSALDKVPAGEQPKDDWFLKLCKCADSCMFADLQTALTEAILNECLRASVSMSATGLVAFAEQEPLHTPLCQFAIEERAYAIVEYPDGDVTTDEHLGALEPYPEVTKGLFRCLNQYSREPWEMLGRIWLCCSL